MGEYYFKSVGFTFGWADFIKINDFIYDYRDQNFTYDKFSELFQTLPNSLVPGQNYTLLYPKTEKV